MIYICITLPKLDSIKNIPSNYRAHLLAPARLRNCTCSARQLHAPRTGRLRVPCKTRRRGGQGSTKKWSTKLGSPWRRNNNGFSRTGTDRPIPAPPRIRIPHRTVPVPPPADSSKVHRQVHTADRHRLPQTGTGGYTPQAEDVSANGGG